MTNNYYKEQQFLVQVDQSDNIIGQIEKWKAHKEGILHRGYTAILAFDEQIILQHRKHPVFDKVFDLSFSSHQLYKDGKLQTDEEAIYEGLKREWKIDECEIRSLKFLNKIYYKAKDEKSQYVEHEIDYVYLVTLNKLPVAVAEYAYGQEVILRKNLASKIYHLGSSLAPWVNKILEEKLI